MADALATIIELNNKIRMLEKTVIYQDKEIKRLEDKLAFLYEFNNMVVPNEKTD